ncbi:hypothetical protein [Leifsonia virtsii]|uniref:Uncharacterized protein n=1 Tax=Leifsonia virtsii TaxID=3035915 RepID=A0ABT8IXQ9_9MICO|nr:hypothetical protein [Leifsonia virtsii]MDN4597593.1 hypothetical protein [Leifsonia virtsii]
MTFTSDVSRAIDELRASFPDSSVVAEETGDGGAWVLIDPVSIGAAFTVEQTWVRFRIPFTYPEADIYPLFIAPDLRRRDGAELRAEHGFQQVMCGPDGTIPSTQLSRTTRGLQSGWNNAAGKLLKVLRWLEQQ